MAAAYVSAADVAKALELPPDAALTAASLAGAHGVDYGAPAAPNPGQPTRIANLLTGAQVAVGYLGSTVELAVVAAATPTTLSFEGPLVHPHGIGERILEVTMLTTPALAASRMWDDVTRGRPEWFAYGQPTETRSVKVDRFGTIPVPVVKRNVLAVTAFSWQLPGMPPAAMPPGVVAAAAGFDDDSYSVLIDPAVGNAFPPAPFSTVRVAITYVAGYAYPGVVALGPPLPAPPEMPGDVSRSVAALAARLWKEKDSGFSDTLGSNTDGTLTYKRDAPTDVKAMARSWVRAGFGT